MFQTNLSLGWLLTTIKKLSISTPEDQGYNCCLFLLQFSSNKFRKCKSKTKRTKRFYLSWVHASSLFSKQKVIQWRAKLLENSSHIRSVIIVSNREWTPVWVDRTQLRFLDKASKSCDTGYVSKQFFRH